MHANLDPFSFSAGPCTDLMGNDHVGLPAHAENRILGLRTGMYENAARLVIETSDEVEVSFFLYPIPTGLLSICRHLPGR